MTCGLWGLADWHSILVLFFILNEAVKAQDLALIQGQDTSVIIDLPASTQCLARGWRSDRFSFLLLHLRLMGPRLIAFTPWQWATLI